MTSPKPSNTQVAPVYSPQAILNIFNNALKISAEHTLIRIKGIYEKGKGMEYYGYFYDVLHDEAAGCNMTLKVPALIRERLVAGRLIEFTGFVARRLEEKGGTIKIHLNLTELHEVKRSEFSAEEHLALDIIKSKADKGYKEVDGFLTKCILDDTPPLISVYIGNTSIIDKDIHHALGEAAEFFDLHFIRISLTSLQDILSVFDDDESDIIILARGGGSGLEIFSTLELSEKALSLEAYFITAIGHREDVSLLDKVADKSFITPTALGNHLRQLYNKTIEDMQGSKARLTEEIKTQVRLGYEHELQLYKGLISSKDAELNAFRNRRPGITVKQVLIYMLLSLLIGFVLAVLLRG
jgi:exodeoxyribonuclease VII large subunit